MRTPEEVKLTYNKETGLLFPLFQLDCRRDTILEEIKDLNSLFSHVSFSPSNEDCKPIVSLLDGFLLLLTSEGKLYVLRGILRDVLDPSSVMFELYKTGSNPREVWSNSSSHFGLLDFSSIPLKKLDKLSSPDSTKVFQSLFTEEVEDEDGAGTRSMIYVVPQDNLKTIKVIFLDKEERFWCEDSLNKSSVSFDGVCSELNVQRSSTEDEDDYAMWPLEMKLFFPGVDSAKPKVFPLLVRNNFKESPKDQDAVNTICCSLQLLIPEMLKEIRMFAIKCEISLSRNGEKQFWNLDC